MTTSKITGKTYDESCVLYLTNAQQVYKYLANGAEQDLLDILYTDTKYNRLVFVFNKSKLISDLYEKWNNHTLK